MTDEELLAEYEAAEAADRAARAAAEAQRPEESADPPPVKLTFSGGNSCRPSTDKLPRPRTGRIAAVYWPGRPDVPSLDSYYCPDCKGDNPCKACCARYVSDRDELYAKQRAFYNAQKLRENHHRNDNRGSWSTAVSPIRTGRSTRTRHPATT